MATPEEIRQRAAEMVLRYGRPENESELKEMIDRALEIRQAPIFLLDLYLEALLLAMMRSYFADIEPLRFVEEGHADNKVVIMSEYPRSADMQKDKLPRIIVQAAGMVASPLATNDVMPSSLNTFIGNPMRRDEAVGIALPIQIIVVSENSNFCKFISGYVFAYMLAHRHIIREHFNFQKIGLPNKSPIGTDRQLPDYFNCVVSLTAEAIGSWQETITHKAYRQILFDFTTQMVDVVEGLTQSVLIKDPRA